MGAAPVVARTAPDVVAVVVSAATVVDMSPVDAAEVGDVVTGVVGGVVGGVGVLSMVVRVKGSTTAAASRTVTSRSAGVTSVPVGAFTATVYLPGVAVVNV